MYLSITHILCEAYSLMSSFLDIRVLESPSNFMENTVAQVSAKGEVLQ